MADIVFIEQLRARGKHGVSDEERSREQDFLIDIRMECDTTRAAQSHDINDAVDYSSTRAAVKELIASKSYKLIETLAHLISDMVLGNPKVSAVEVTIRKVEVYPDAVPGVTVRRVRG